jgi:hypothetical protein
MDARREIRRKIERKRAEIEHLRAESRELEAKIRESVAYITALEETLKLLPAETAADAGSALRPDSAIAKAREVILKARKPLHLNEILRALGKPADHDHKASLSGSIGFYVRQNQIFTRPAPNTFGLVEFQQESKTDELPPDFGVISAESESEASERVAPDRARNTSGAKPRPQEGQEGQVRLSAV